jgi:hypothetical protein
MEWAYEANDKSILAWTVFRRSQQATVSLATGLIAASVVAIGWIPDLCGVCYGCRGR